MKEFLRQVQYKNADNFETRMSLWHLEKPYWDWFIGRYDFSQAKKILEVGCGPAHFWEHASSKLNKEQILVLTDFSEGMITNAKNNLQRINFPCSVDFQVADVEKLTFPDHSFDLVMAHLMIYHANSPQQALHEIKRVLTQTGYAGISTLPVNTNHQLLELAHEIDPRVPPYSIVAPFAEEKADEMLPEIFNTISKSRYPITTKVTHVEDIIQYYKTYPSIQQLAPTEEFYTECKKRAEAIIAKEGAFLITSCVVHYLCS